LTRARTCDIITPESNKEDKKMFAVLRDEYMSVVRVDENLKVIGPRHMAGKVLSPEDEGYKWFRASENKLSDSDIALTLF
jgi:hypothetical protein